MRRRGKIIPFCARIEGSKHKQVEQPSAKSALYRRVQSRQKPALQLEGMADKLIGSLIYGEHEVPKRSRNWREALKVPVYIGLALIFIAGLAYKFANFREERRTTQFIEA